MARAHHFTRGDVGLSPSRVCLITLSCLQTALSCLPNHPLVLADHSLVFAYRFPVCRLLQVGLSGPQSKNLAWRGIQSAS